MAVDRGEFAPALGNQCERCGGVAGQPLNFAASCRIAGIAFG